MITTVKAHPLLSGTGCVASDGGSRGCAAGAGWASPPRSAGLRGPPWPSGRAVPVRPCAAALLPPLEGLEREGCTDAP